MLARANRLISADEFRTTAGRGRRRQTDHLVVTVRSTSGDQPARFGFTLTKKVGSAVTRNQIRRQLRAIAWQLVCDGARGVDVVVRGRARCSDADWASLHTELSAAVWTAEVQGEEVVGR